MRILSRKFRKIDLSEENMKLYTAPTSPFGRKATIVALEYNIDVEQEDCNPFDSDKLSGINPLRLIPVLQLDDGSIICDSFVICEFFDSIRKGPTLYPDIERWAWSNRMIMGHGLGDASVQLRLQQVLPTEERSKTLMKRYQDRISRTLALFEKEVTALSEGDLRIDKVCVVIGLGHLEFRHGGKWRVEAPKLSGWYDKIMKRPSFLETSPSG